MAEPKKLEVDDIMAALKAAAENVEKGGDCFTIKVYRKKGPAGGLDHIATVSEASVAHLANPEYWLPQLAGGGPQFVVEPFHVSDPTTKVGGMIQVSVPGTPKEVDISAPYRSTWRGPKKLEYPEPPNPQAAMATMFGGAAPVERGSGATAPRDMLQFPIGLGPQPYDPRFDRFDRFPPPLPMSDPKLEAELADLRRERAALAAQLADAKAATALEQVRRESAAQIAGLQAQVEKLVAMQAQPRVEPQKNTLAELVTALGPIVAPLITSIMQGQQELRMAMMKAESDRAAQNQAMMLQFSQRPAIDPAMEKMLAQQAEQTKNFMEMQIKLATAKPGSDDAAQLVRQMAEMSSSMARSQFELLDVAMQMGLGGGKQDDPPALKAVREGVKALNALMQGYMASVGGPPQAKPPVPPGQRYPQPQPMQQRALPPQQQVPQQQARPPQAQPQPQTPPANVVPFPQPQAAPVAPQQQQSFGEASLGTPAPTTPATPGTPVGPPPPLSLDQIEELIHHYQPPEQVAAAVITSIQREEPTLREAIVAADGDIQEMASRRLGPWVMSQGEPAAAYLTEVLKNIEAQGDALNMWDGDGDDGDEDEEDDDGDDDSDDDDDSSDE